MAQLPDKIYESILAQTTKLLMAESFSIALCGPGPDQITYELSVDRGVKRVPQTRELGDGLSEIVVRTGKPLLVRNFELEDGTLPLSWMGAPILSGEKVLGLIAVQCSREDAYERRDLFILTALAGWTSSVVEADRLIRCQTQETESSAALLRVTRALGGETEEKQLLGSAVEIVPTVVECDRCSAWWWSEARREFEPACRCTMSNRKPQELASAPLQPQGVPALQSLIESMEVVTISAAEADQLGDLRAMLSNDLQSVALVPLQSEGELAGLIAVVKAQEGRGFTSREVDLLRGLADIVALSLQNLRHHRQKGEAAALRELNEVKSRLISTISHELRTPLSFVQAGSELLMQRLLDPEQLRQVAGLVNQGSMRLAEIVDDIIQFADLQSGCVSLSFESSDPMLVVQEAIDEAVGVAAGNRVLLRSEQQLPTVEIDREKVKSVVVRLVRNGLNFSDGQSPVQLCVSMDSGHLRIEIIDRGFGIPQDEVSKVFEPFFRGETSQSKCIPGAGLGLSIVKQLVDAMGGEVSVTSRSGEGTTVAVSLPVQAGDNGSAEKMGHNSAPLIQPRREQQL